MKDGQTVARATPDLPAPEKDGRRVYVGMFPATAFKPGRYEVRVTARRGEISLQEKASFSLGSGS